MHHNKITQSCTNIHILKKGEKNNERKMSVQDTGYCTVQQTHTQFFSIDRCSNIQNICENTTVYNIT